MVWLQGLCNIGYSAESYTRIITSDSGRDRHERMWAALAGSPKTEEPYTVLETALPILTNDTENIQLRIIALHMFLSSSNIRETDLLFVHNYISNCSSNQLKRFWYSTVKNLEGSKDFTGYKTASYYIPFIADQVSNPDPMYWATSNYIISGEEDIGTPSLQVLSAGDALGGMPAFLGVKLNTGGRRSYKVAVYVIVEGVTTRIHNKMYKFSMKDLNVEQLVQVLKDMKGWKVKAQEKVHIDIVIKVHDKTVYASHMNQSRFENWNGEDLAYVEDFLRFGSHINQQIVYYPFQTETHVPSELGTPIRLQSTILSFTSIRGNLTAPSTRDLTWRNDLHIRYQGSSVISLSTVGPLVQTIHSARVQHSVVAHLPMIFNVSFSTGDRSVELSWPNPGDQQSGVAMHSRARISTETMAEGNATAVTADNVVNDSGNSIFFDCEHPLSWAELVDKLLSSKTGHHDTFSFIQPQLFIASTMALFSGSTSSRCGVILQPWQLPRSSNDVLRATLTLQSLKLPEDSIKLRTALTVTHTGQDPEDVYLNIKAAFMMESTDSNLNFQLTVNGHHITNDSIKHEWTVCLKEHDVSHAASDQDISVLPASYEGHLTLTFTSNKTECVESTSASVLIMKYKGIPQNLQGSMSRYFEVKIFGRNLSQMGILESDLVSQTAWGQLLRSYSQDPINVTAIIRERNGFASLSVNDGAEMQLKSEGFGWLLDSWTDMQLMKSFGLYRECSIQESVVQTLSRELESMPTSQCPQNLILADCSDNTPRFAIIRTAEGMIMYSGGHSVLVKDSGVVVRDDANDQFWISATDSTIRVTARATDVRLYRRRNETVILVPHVYMSGVCGLCARSVEYTSC